METQLSLAQLYPLRQLVVLLIDIISQFADIVQTLGIVGIIGILSNLVCLMTNAVDKWQNTHRHRYLGTLLQVAALIALHTQTGLGNFLVLLLQQVVILRILLTLTIETVEEPQQENHQQNGNDNGEQHPVELAGLMVENACTGFEFTILACLLLQVYIDVTIIVTLGFVVDG